MQSHLGRLLHCRVPIDPLTGAQVRPVHRTYHHVRIHTLLNELKAAELVLVAVLMQRCDSGKATVPISHSLRRSYDHLLIIVVLPFLFAHVCWKLRSSE